MQLEITADWILTEFSKNIPMMDFDVLKMTLLMMNLVGSGLLMFLNPIAGGLNWH